MINVETTEKIKKLLQEFIHAIDKTPALLNLPVGGYIQNKPSILFVEQLGDGPLSQTSFAEHSRNLGVIATTDYFVKHIKKILGPNPELLATLVKCWEPILDRLISRIGQDNLQKLKKLNLVEPELYDAIDDKILEQWLSMVWEIKKQFSHYCTLLAKDERENEQLKLQGLEAERQKITQQYLMTLEENKKLQAEGVLAPNATHLKKPTSIDFEKIEYCYQFNPVIGFTIDKDETRVITNPAFKQKSDHHKREMQARAEKDSAAFFKAKWDQLPEGIDEKKWRKRSHDFYLQLCEHYKDSTNYPNLNTIYLWHGTDESSFKSIQNTGFTPLALTDSGYFGKGIYGTLDVKYANIYPLRYTPKDERVLLLKERI